MHQNLLLMRVPIHGAKGTRIPDPFNAIEVLYQLSYSPELVLMLFIMPGDGAIVKVLTKLIPSAPADH